MLDVVLCIDIGTTSLKAGLITALGEVVSFCTVPFEEPNNRFTACSWYSVFLRALERLDFELSNSKNPLDSGGLQISGISISGNGPTVVTDCGYTVLWNEDTSDIKIPASEEVKKSLFVPKLLAVKNKAAGVYKKSKLIFSGPEFFIYVLTGQAVTILPEERFMPAYWNDGVCQTCGIKNTLLPPFVDIGTKCGTISSEILKEMRYASKEGSFAFSENCPVFAGGPDFIVALIGTGTLHAGRLCDRCGSSEGLNFCTDKILKGDGLRILPSVIPGLWNASYLIPDSGELSEAERLVKVEQGICCLKNAADKAGISFPEEMAVTGGQTNDELLLREKEERLGMKILRPAGGHFVHSELLGDACAAWMGLGIYNSLPAAAEEIVRLQPYENL